MSFAFWDTSALVPLCVQQQPSATVSQLSQQHEIAVWWATPVEMRSAFERLLRMGQLTPQRYLAAGTRMEQLRRGWREVQPTAALRSEAETLLSRYTLKAADAFQLAAAWVWCSGRSGSCLFVSGDVQLLEAARQLGFQAPLV